MDSTSFGAVADVRASYDRYDKPSFGDLISTPNLLEKPLVSDASGRIEWAGSLTDGIARAQKEGKPLVCVFEEDSCGWCKRFDQELTKPAAADLGRDAIFVRISPSKDPEGNGLATSLGINSYPTVSVLDIQGSNISERTRMTGFMTADDFARRIHSNATAIV